MSQRFKIIATSLIGNVIEYFGFTILMVFIKEIGITFFPNFSPEYRETIIFLLFGAGFITRPIGAILFGHIGDRFGRKKALSTTILGMAVVTFFIAIIPGYSSIGIFAPLALVLLRLAQGVFVGGEGPGSALYMLEHSKKEDKISTGGIIISSIVAGSFLATLSGVIISNIGINPELAWRIPFVIVSILGVVGIYLRVSLPETNDFIKAQKEKKIVKLPILKSLRLYWKQMILIASLGGITTSASYLVMAYIGNYLKSYAGIAPHVAMKYSLLSISLYILSLLVIGRLCSTLSAKKIIITFNALILLAIVPIFLCLRSENGFLFFSAIIALPVLTAGLCAPAYPYATEIFKTEVRSSGIGASYTIGIAIFGGFTPAICNYLIKITGIYYSPSFYIIFLALIYWMFERLFGVSLSEQAT